MEFYEVSRRRSSPNCHVISSERHTLKAVFVAMSKGTGIRYLKLKFKVKKIPN